MFKLHRLAKTFFEEKKNGKKISKRGKFFFRGKKSTGKCPLPVKSFGLTAVEQISKTPEETTFHHI